MKTFKIAKHCAEYADDIAYAAGVADGGALKGSHVVITGAGGLMGVTLTDTLLEAGCRVTAVVRNAGRLGGRLDDHLGDPAFDVVEQDATAALPDGLRPDYIIPLASNTHPLAYSEHPVETMMTNIMGAKWALEKSRATGAMVIYPSSVEIYGNARGNDTFTEDYTGQLSLGTARSCYNESKRSCEAMCQSYAKEYGVRVRIARLSRIFGPTMLASDTKASSQFILKALAGEDIVMKSNGEQLYSYTYSADAAAAMLHIMLNGEDGEAYNVCSRKTNVRLRDFAEACAEICGRRVVFDIPSEAEAAGYSKATVAIMDGSKLEARGFAPRYEMRDAIDRTIKVLRESV